MNVNKLSISSSRGTEYWWLGGDWNGTAWWGYWCMDGWEAIEGDGAESGFKSAFNLLRSHLFIDF